MATMLPALPKSASTKSLSRIGASYLKNRNAPAISFKTTTRHIHSAATFRTAAATLDQSSIPGFEVLSQFNYLRDFTKSFPYILDKKAEPKDGEFVFPLGTLFKGPSRDVVLSMTDLYACALKEYGVAAIELQFDDPKSQILLDIVDAMGCKPDTHSSTEGALWDITYKPSGVFSAALGKNAHSRSHGLGEFAWHTDGSYEVSPQRYFGFHIIHPDKKGGGIFRVLDANRLVKLLSPAAVEALTTYEFDILVPDEFYKGVKSNKSKLMHIDPKTGHAQVRFRSDILNDPPSDNPAANAAVEEMRNLLDPPESVGQRMPEYAFKENVILLMDNARFLHCRNDIKDPKRLLRRVRFNGTPGGNVEKD